MGFVLFGQTDIDELQKYGIKNKAPKGLEIGSKAPDFKVNTIDGLELDLSNVLDSSNIVLVFFRGSWCPYCTRHIAELMQYKDVFDDRETQLVFVTPHKENYLSDLQEELNKGAYLISDEELHILEDYDVLFEVNKSYQAKFANAFNQELSGVNVQDKAVLPVPATYLIGKDGLIKFKHFEYNYTHRSVVGDILKHL